MPKTDAVKIDIKTQPMDMHPQRIMELVKTAEESKREVDIKSATIDALMNCVASSMAAGWPFQCSECLFKGFSVDFVRLASGTCPNCGRQGKLTLRLVAPLEYSSKSELVDFASRFKTAYSWLNNQADTPAAIRADMDSLRDFLSNLGVYRA